MTELRKFQKQFVKGALAPGVDVSALSIPRGNGKSWLAAHLLTRALTPGDDLHVPGSEYLLCAASLEQARLCYRFIRADLEPTGAYRFIDSTTRLGIVHKDSNTRLRVLSSNGKTAMGILGCPLLVADEPGSWEVGGGGLMYDAIVTALGKPDSPMKVIFIGTLAPSTSGWWHDMIADGTKPTIFVQSLQGDVAKWDKWAEIRRCNPLTAVSPEFRKRLRVERDEARIDTRLKARFQSYRLNLPSGDESTVLLTTVDFDKVTAREVPERSGRPIVGIDLGGGRAWSAAVALWPNGRVTAREVPERSGRPIVGIDLGGGRAWSAAVALWPNGRVEAKAVAPGIPGLDEQERRDRQPPGTYTRLYAEGSLMVAEGLRVQPPAQVWQMVKETWGKPQVIVCDRFRLPELQDAVKHGARMEPRIARWSDAAFDIRALRQQALDGPLSVDKDSRALLATSLSTSIVKSDDQGNTRLVKSASNNTSRDDVAQALVLASGALARKPKRTGVRSLGLA